MKKISIDRELRREMVVGAFAFLVVLGLFLFSIFITGEIFVGKKQELRVLFKDVMGLRVGERVVCRGMSVGEVKELSLLPMKGKVEVLCYLDKPVHLREKYAITIEPTSLLGGRLVRIREGPADGAEVPEGAVLEGRMPFDLVQETGELVTSVRRTVEAGGVLTNLQVAVAQAREIVEKMNDGTGTLAQLINDKAVYDDMKAVAASLKIIAKKLESGKGVLSGLVHDEEMYADMKAAVGNLREISQRLADGKGLLGQLLAEDDELSAEVKLFVQDIRAAVDDFRETAPILTFTSVFFGAL